LQIALHDDAVGDLQHEQTEPSAGPPQKWKSNLKDVQLVVATAITKTAAGEDEHDQGNTAAARGAREKASRERPHSKTSLTMWQGRQGAG